VTVIRHPKEKISKSSIVPSKIISPDQVEIRHDMDVPTLIEEGAPYDSVVLLFPTDDAKNLTEMSEEELKGIKKLIIIDSTWNQTRHFLIQPNVAKLKKVKI
jgi:DTW domain-containing protein YfiP